MVICYIRAVSTSAQSGRVSTVPMRMASAPAPISKNSTATCCGLQDHIFDEQGNAAVRIVEELQLGIGVQQLGGDLDLDAVGGADAPALHPADAGSSLAL